MRRLNPAVLTLMMFGVVGLLVAAYVAKNLLAREEAAPQATTRNVPMAIADIPAGTLITESHLGMGPYPIDRLDRDMLLVNRVIVGRIAKEAIKPAVPIKANQLYQPGELPSLADKVAPGMRAVSVDVANAGAMVDGLVKPGEYVDVLFTYNSNADDDRFQGGLTMRLFEGVKVIALNRNLQQSRIDRSNNHVTLELTETQANIVTLAKQRGSLTLTFNPSGAGDGGLALSNDERVTLYEILGLKPQEPEPEPFMSEIYRGSGRDIHYFNGKGRRLDGWGGRRQGFDYRRYFGLPNDADYRGYDNRMGLPPTSATPAAPPAATGAPTVSNPSDAPMSPTDYSNSRRAPTASRMIPMNN
ncbi:MAG: Flp pilus assembly protein CpaB [Planctomycetales bacterium 12-60-4]|nr:MAG: Flp pilus assembly protein CpaB [Planctomycetales bacterium 12-60-4]